MASLPLPLSVPQLDASWPVFPFPCQCHSWMRHGQSQLPVLARLEGPGEVMCQHGEARGGPDWAEGKGGKA